MSDDGASDELKSRPAPSQTTTNLNSDLDAIYFDATRRWGERLAAILERADLQTPFRRESARLVKNVLEAEHPGLRAVINMGAASLCGFLAEGRYKNAYERPRVDGVEKPPPSPERLRADQLLFGQDGKSHYFAAVCLGGTGCRYYGEYCVVLVPERNQQSQVFDRNSYDLLGPPLSLALDSAAVVAALRGRWDADVSAMLTAKVAPELPEENRLTTPGQVSDAVSHDEDFAEVHLRGDVTSEHVEEVRATPEDSIVASELLDEYGAGEIPDPTELIWSTWRHCVSDQLRSRDVAHRVVSTTGRGFRWR